LYLVELEEDARTTFVVVVVVLGHTGAPVSDGHVASLALRGRVVEVAHDLVLAGACGLSWLFVLCKFQQI
jgi:hypothetical protein